MPRVKGRERRAPHPLPASAEVPGQRGRGPGASPRSMSQTQASVMPPNHEPFDIQEFLRAGGSTGRVVEYRRGDVIYEQGGPCDAVLYIQKGAVKLQVFSRARSLTTASMVSCGKHNTARSGRQGSNHHRAAGRGATSSCRGKSLEGYYWGR